MFLSLLSFSLSSISLSCLSLALASSLLFSLGLFLSSSLFLSLGLFLSSSLFLSNSFSLLSLLFLIRFLSQKIFIYILIYYGMCMRFETRGHRGFFEYFGECPRLVLDFNASSGRLVFILYLSLNSYFVLGYALIFVCGRVTRIIHVPCLQRMLVLVSFHSCANVMHVMLSITALLYACD